MTNPHTTAIILLAGGSGSRMGADEAKQFIRIAGKPILVHTYEALRRHMPDAPMVVTVPLESLSRVRAMLPTDDVHVQVVTGGSSRQMSTLAGLRALRAQQPHNVLIHDAARPFVSGQIIYDVLQALEKDEAVDVAIPTADTIIVERDGYIQSIPKRTYLRRGQTPQAFRYDVLVRAYADVGDERLDQFTDDCGIYLETRPFGKVRVISGHEENFKVTYPLDLVLADELFRRTSTLSFNELKQSDNQGKVIVIFGGTKGIGLAISNLLKAEGASAVTYSRVNGFDIRKKFDIDKALKITFNEFGKIDAIVNAAAVLESGELLERTEESINSEISTNFTGSVYLAQLSKRYLAQTKGTLILFSSSSFTRGRAGTVIYSATKAAIVNLTQGLAEEWEQEHIRVNCVVPPRTNTTMRRINFPGEDRNTLISPYEVAQKTSELICSKLTGAIIRITGK